VFGDLKVKDSAEVLDNWARIKVEKEGRRPKDSILDGVSRGLPPLDRAWKLQKKAAKAGFDWPCLQGVAAKVAEELAEVSEAAGAPETENAAEAARGAAAPTVEEELGDLLFSAVNLCRFLGVEPSVALQKANVKFTGRFGHVERRMRETGQEMKQENLAVMNGFWEEAKGPERRTDPAAGSGS
jgi:tetrapyrrole methylase family protein/MazG family protein